MANEKIENNNKLKSIHFNVDNVENLKPLRKFPRNWCERIFFKNLIFMKP